MLIDKLLVNEKIRNHVEELVEKDRQTSSDLEPKEAGYLEDLCVDGVIEKMEKDEIAEIILNGIDETTLHDLLAELFMSKDRLDEKDAQQAIKAETDRFLRAFVKCRLYDEDTINWLIDDVASNVKQLRYEDLGFRRFESTVRGRTYLQRVQGGF